MNDDGRRKKEELEKKYRLASDQSLSISMRDRADEDQRLKRTDKVEKAEGRKEKGKQK